MKSLARLYVFGWLVLLSLILTSPVRSEFTVNELNGFNVSSVPSIVASVTYLQCSAEDTTDQTTYTFTSQNTGTATADRYTAIAIIAEDATAAFNVSSMTVGGDAGTAVQNDATATGGRYAGLFILSNTAGTSETVSVTMSEPITGMRVCLWQINNITSATAVASTTGAGSPTATASINVSAFGIAIGGCMGGSNSATNTWAGLTERDDLTGTEISTTVADFTNDSSADSPLTITDTITAAGATCATASFL